MNELIKLNQTKINDETVQTVNARELHAFLQSKQDFSTWIKNRIEQYDFVENKDFINLHKKMENPQGGRPAIEYYLTLDMAKELAMVERNDKGKQPQKKPLMQLTLIFSCFRSNKKPPEMAVWLIDFG